jgi:hypothetical protein
VLRGQIAGRHAAWTSGPVHPRCALPAGEGNLTGAGETAAIRPAVERPWPLWAWSLRPWKRPRELLPRELLPGGERPGGWLLDERSAAWASGAGVVCAGLPRAHLAVAWKTPAILSAAVRSPAVRRSRIGPTRLRTGRPVGAVLLAAILPIGLRRAAPRPAAGKLAGVSRPPLLGPVRPGGRCALRAAGNRALHPGTGGRHGLPARSVAIGANVPRPRPPGGLADETGAAGESTRRRSGTAGRNGTAAHVVVTGSPGKPRTPIPRALVTRQTGIASWTGAPADPGVGISPAFVVRPVFGARPPTPAPPPREPCHVIDRRHPGDR